MVIAIDGPAGSGKTTTARALAKRLGIFYLDTGATYRALTYAALAAGIDVSDGARLKELAKNLALRLESDEVYLGSANITAAIRQPRIDKSISAVVAHPGVRRVMVRLQRQLASGRDCVVEGRDTTSVVFPDAAYKFFLDADPQKRAYRRFRELRDRAFEIDLKEVETDLLRRDTADRTRAVGPLVKGPDAVVIDTTDLTIKETVDEIIKCLDASAEPKRDSV